MRTRDAIYMAWRYTRMRWFESLLIVMAIGLGSGVLGGVASLVVSFSMQINNTFDNPQVRKLQVQPVESLTSEFAGDSPATPLPATAATAKPPSFGWSDLQEAKASIPGIGHVYVEMSRGYPLAGAALTPAPVGGDTEAYLAYVRQRERSVVWTMLTTADYFQANDLLLLSGSLWTEDDVAVGRPVTVIGRQLAARLFGDENPVGREIKLQQFTLTVVGVVGVDPARKAQVPPGGPLRAEELAILPFTAVGPGTVDSFQLLPAAGADLGAVTTATRAYIQARYGEAVSVAFGSEEFRQVLGEAVKIAAVIGVFGSLALWIAAINILNLMLARVLRRTRALGLAKALGASRSVVFRQSLVESLLLGGAGSLLGLLLSIGATALIRLMTRDELMLTPWANASSLLIAIAVSLIFGIYPAMQSAAVQPAEALRAE